MISDSDVTSASAWQALLPNSLASSSAAALIDIVHRRYRVVAIQFQMAGHIGTHSTDSDKTNRVTHNKGKRFRLEPRKLENFTGRINP